MNRLDAYGWLRNDPDGACAGVLVVVAAARPVEAARLLRAAGWHRVRPERTWPVEEEDRRAALAEPGVVLWRPLDARPPYAYRRDRPGGSAVRHRGHTSPAPVIDAGSDGHEARGA